MQQKNKWLLAAPLLAVFSILSLSFSSMPGGDSYEIYVNNKLVCQRFLHEEKAVQTISWSQGNSNDKVEIYYSHCGTVGKNRVIAIKDANDKILKKIGFENASSGKNKAMSCTVKDILNAGKGTVYLYYTSAELPKGKLLAAVKGS